MKQPSTFLFRSGAAVAALLAALSAQAQTAPMAAEQASSDANLPAATLRHQKAEIARGDPARWSQEDATARARLRTIHKEIAAGLQESLGACKRMAAAERSGCNAEARAIYKQEMAGARARAMEE
ncbi:MAG: hypothetical protein V4723_17230 [Pseudomonadota bacterium]